MNETEIKPVAAIDPRREADWDDLCNDPASLRHFLAEFDFMREQVEVTPNRLFVGRAR